MKHYCGLFGVVFKENYSGVLGDVINGLNLLQHRGQDSAGASYILKHLNNNNNEDVIHLYKNLGLVKNVFSDELKSNVVRYGISHVRYSTRVKTSIKKQIEEAQPFVFNVLLSKSGHCVHKYEQFSIAHNGNIPNIAKLKDKYGIVLGATEETESDSYILGKILQKFLSDMYFSDSRSDNLNHNDWIEVLSKFVNEISGVYCLLILTKFGVYAIKDSSGVRPLSIAQFKDKTVITSESVALTSLTDNCEKMNVRELDAGEIVFVDSKNVQTVYKKSKTINTFCSFEYIYFLRHNSVFRGQNIEEVRFNLGKELAEQELHSRDEKCDSQIVICVPQTSISSAKGFAARMNIPYVDGIVKAVNANRTFILPNDNERMNACQKKFIYVDELLRNKRIYLVDDSIVRGNTLKSVVEHLRECGVIEIHVRIPSPPIVSECYYGIDMSTKKELLAYNHTIEKMMEILNVDSLAYLELERMKSVFSKGNNENEIVCTSCFTGKYNAEILDW